MSGIVIEGRPVRVQLRRTKGWRMPANTVSVGNGPWYALFQAIEWQAGDKAIAVVDLREMMKEAALDRPFSATADLVPLRGKNLACWCPLDQPCHADVLLDLANTPPGLDAEGMKDV
jgi:hypothetical protein